MKIAAVVEVSGGTGVKAVGVVGVYGGTGMEVIGAVGVVGVKDKNGMLNGTVEL